MQYQKKKIEQEVFFPYSLLLPAIHEDSFLVHKGHLSFMDCLCLVHWKKSVQTIYWEKKKQTNREGHVKSRGKSLPRHNFFYKYCLLRRVGH